MAESFDHIVIGAGIVGLATALELQRRDPAARIAVLEKEPAPAAHQTGRNSGVIHAGVYYAPGSLKARFCRAGVAATTDFCNEHGVPFETCGKLIVATTEAEVARLGALHDRATANGIEIHPVDGDELHAMEPNISGLSGLHSPSTGIVDYGAMARVMADLFIARGGALRTGVTVHGGRTDADGATVRTDRGDFACGRLICCAGLFSDRMITAFGGTPEFRIVPFRGEYYRIDNQPPDLVRHLIYPVPDPARPFLGVHLTRKIGGKFTVGPNAVLAMKREGYSRTAVSPRDMATTLGWPGFWRMLARNSGAAASELSASAFKRLYLKKVQTYCARVQLDDLTPIPPGVRAQAVGRDGGIIDDFVFVQEGPVLHVGNAPSPAATAAIPIARHIAERAGL